MKVLLLLGLVAVALCEPTKFVGDKVLRLTPGSEEDVTIIREIGHKVKVDFWKPDSPDLVTIGMNVDIHVPAAQLDMVFTILQQSGIEVKIMFENLQEAVEAQMDNKRATKAHDYTKYNNWATINDWVVSISSANADLISRQVIGNTYEGRPMHLLKDRMWRKTRSKNSGSSCIGTDPNRNFDAGWCTTGASSNPCSETYCGSSVESEIESKNLANFIRSNKSIIKAYLTVHSYSQLLLFPYSYKYGLAADHSELLSVSQGAIAALRSLHGTRYTSGPGAVTIYPAAGGSDDWAYDLGVKYSYTFELRDEGRYGFLLPESQIKPTCEETMLAVKYIASYVLNNLY
uniref:Carboxypeptidase B n=1 Tax=Cyprinus carpio carpio TaxID=630221 RepID=A0A8C1B507_CYPCA